MFTDATYHKLIKADGQPQYGCFPRPFTEINYRDFDYRNTMDQPARPWHKHFHYKQFQFIGLYSQDYILGCTIANVRYAANAFIYLFDQNKQQLQSHSLLRPLSMGCKLSSQPYSGHSYLHRGSNHFEIKALGQGKGYQLQLELNKGIKLSLEITPKPQFQPLCLCTKTGYNGWTYTQKETCLEVDGVINWEGEQINLGAEQFQAIYDWSAGYMRRQTAWNWASFSGTSEGKSVGLNLSNGVNETGLNENAFWVNGELNRISPVQMLFNRDDRMQPWQIRTEDGSVKLEFEPKASHGEKVNAWVLASNFHQLPGLFTGTIIDKAGTCHQLTSVPGVVEDHYAKW